MASDFPRLAEPRLGLDWILLPKEFALPGMGA